MGLFNFSKKKAAEIRDLIWINHSAKIEGTKKFIKEHDNIVLIAWFQGAYDEFNQQLNARDGLGLEILMARTVHVSTIIGKNLVFLEHYPIRSKEEEFIQKAEPTKVFYLSSLDEPLFKQFGGEKVIQMMKNLGMKEDEFIEHPMISKAIESAQRKIAEKISVENSANSTVEWFERNLP